MRTVKYKIEYFNRAYNESYSMEKDDKDEAVALAKDISTLLEIEDVRLYELKEIDLQSYNIK